MTAEPTFARHALGFVFGVLDATAIPGPILVELCGSVGFAEDATRQLLARMVRSGDLESRRVGRVSVYSLAGQYRSRWERLRHGDCPPAWSGAFHVVIYEVSERHRRYRDALNEAAARAGFARLRPGLLLGLSAPIWLETLGRQRSCLVETGNLAVDLETARRLAAHAWKVDTAAGELRRLATRLRRELARPDLPRKPNDALREQFEWTRRAGQVRFAVPNLPSELLPAEWPAGEVHQLFGQLNSRFIPVTGKQLYEVLQASPHGHCVEGGWWPPLRDVGSRAAE